MTEEKNEIIVVEGFYSNTLSKNDSNISNVLLFGDYPFNDVKIFVFYMLSLNTSFQLKILMHHCITSHLTLIYHICKFYLKAFRSFFSFSFFGFSTLFFFYCFLKRRFYFFLLFYDFLAFMFTFTYVTNLQNLL